MGQVYSGQGYVQLPLAVPCNMRTKPSVSKNGSWFQSGRGNSTTQGDRGVSVEGLNATDKSAFTQRIFVHNNASNQGNGTTVWCTVPNNSGVYCRLDAEL